MSAVRTGSEFEVREGAEVDFAPPHLVLFDLDDTLCDYAGARAGRLRIAFSTALAHAPNGGSGIDLDHLIGESLAIQPHGSDHFAPLLARHGVDPAAADAARRWYQTNRFLGLMLFEDALETLAVVRAALPERRIGVITNGPAEVQRDKIALLELTAHVDFTLISGEFGVAKPDPAIFHEALKLGHATAGETVFIGDSPEHDIAGAQAAGIRAIWINRSGVPWRAEMTPDDEVDSLTAVRALLDPRT